jgi:hypothetical protein
LTLVSGHEIDNPRIVFDRLMKESGVQSSLPSTERGLDEALRAVSNTLRAQYTLAYYPEQSSNKLRRIEVRVDRPGVHVLARRFVGSDAAFSEVVHFEKETCTVSPKFHPFPYEPKLSPNGMVYREDFTDPGSGWPNHGTSHYVAGGYRLSNDTTAAYGPWWTDFRASVNMNAVLPSEYRANAQVSYALRPAAGLVFRFNQDGYYALLMSGVVGENDWSLKLVKRDFPAGEKVIVPWRTVFVPALGRSGTDLSVEAIRDQIFIFVNDQKVISARDDTYDQGYVGFVVSGPGRATFKNLLVEQK